MRNDMLLVEDVMLLLLDDKTGVPAGAGTLHYTLGGAMLVELALRGRIDTDGTRTGLNGPKVVAVGNDPLSDPLLQSAYDKVARRPRSVQTLLLEIGAGLWKPVVNRLVERGLLRHESKKLLGVFRMTTWPADDTRYEADLRQRIRTVLQDGASPDARTAAVIALLSSSGALQTLRPALPRSAEIRQRAKALENGNWGAAAVNTAVIRNAAAIAASSAAVSVSVITAIT